VRKIVSDLKEFSHAGDNDWHWADVHHGLDTTLNIVWNELKYKCTVTKHYGELPKLHCLPSQLNQVFMNLLVNAAQAIESKGEITITTECLDVAHVRISISDNGSGMPPDVLAHIFQPFYTTKPVGKGTGLGLSLARGIIERHHGKIDVLSVVGKGTTFTITLPVDEAQSDSLIQQT
jgi:signal transduction histidine kinase